MRKSQTPNPRFDDSDTHRRTRQRVTYPGTLVILLGKTDAQVAQFAFGDVSIYEGPLSAEVDTGRNINAFNRGQVINAGIWVEMKRRGGGWEMVPLECNE